MSPGLTESLAQGARSELETSEFDLIDELETSEEAPLFGVQLRAELRGIGMWTEAHGSLEAWVEDGMPERWSVPDKPARPPASMLHSRLRRRTSTLTRAVVTAIEEAVAASGGDLGHTRFVLVSSFGEIETTVTLLSQLGEPGGPISPTKFHNSVHNTATGYLSIAAGNHCEATALAGGPHSLEIGMLEVIAGLAEGGEDALLVFAEERLPPPFDRGDSEQTFAVALHLSALSEERAAEPGLGLELRVEQDLSPKRPTLVPGAGGVGLPAMVGPLLAILREALAFAGGEGSGSSYALGAGHDPAVASRWTTSLRRLEGATSDD